MFVMMRRRTDLRGIGMVFWFAVGAVAIALVGMVIGILPAYHPDLAARLLRLYWFRLTDAVVPLAGACLLMRLLVECLAKKPEGLRGALTAESGDSVGREIFSLGNQRASRHQKLGDNRTGRFRFHNRGDTVCLQQHQPHAIQRATIA